MHNVFEKLYILAEYNRTHQYVSIKKRESPSNLTFTKQHPDTNTSYLAIMPGGNKMFSEHGRTVVNGGGSELACPRPHRSAKDRQASQHSSSRRSNDDLWRSHFRREVSRSHRDGYHLADSPGISRSNSVCGLTDGISLANGHRVRVVSPEDFPEYHMRDWSIDELNQEFARVFNLFPDHVYSLFPSQTFGPFPDDERLTATSCHITEHRPSGPGRTTRLGKGRTLTRSEILRSITSARAYESEIRRHRYDSSRR
jgi:hypothetical protein